MPREYTESKGEDDSWRIDLSVGDELDVLDENPGLKFWCPARVIEIELKRVKITYLDWSSKWDVWIDRSSTRLAVFGTHVFRVGSVLKIGQRIEVFDEHPKREVWSVSYVCDVDPARVKVHFIGFAKKFDEWLSRDSKRIRPFRYRKRKRRNEDVSIKQKKRVPLSDLNGYEMVPKRKRALQSNDPRYVEFERGLSRLGFRVVKSKGDGNCLFRSIASQVYEHDEILSEDNSTEAHRCVRICAVNYMRALRSHFKPFIEGLRVRSVGNRKQENESKVTREEGVSFDEYTREMERDRVWGDDPEITAMCEIYDRPAEIYVYDSRCGAKLMKTFHENRLSSRVPFRLSYYGGGHYDAIVPIIQTATTTNSKLKTKPGIYERTRIELARLMSKEGEGLVSSVTRSEGQMLAQAMEVSRREYEKQSTDLDLALAMSMRDLSVETAIEASMKKQVHDTMEVSREEEERRRIDEATRMSLASATGATSSISSSSKIELDAEDAMLQAAIAASMTSSDVHNQVASSENPMIGNLVALSGQSRDICKRALEISSGDFQKALDFLVPS